MNGTHSDDAKGIILGSRRVGVAADAVLVLSAEPVDDDDARRLAAGRGVERFGVGHCC